MTAKTVHLQTLPIHVLLSDGSIATRSSQICLNPHHSLSLIIPFSPIRQKWGRQLFFIFKKYIQTNSIPSLWTAFNKKFYGHCDVNDCGHCGSFSPSVRGSPKLAEDHCERVETLHFQPTQMLDKNNHRPRQGALCVLVVCNLHVFVLIFRSAVLYSKRIHVTCYLEPPLTSLPKVLRCT